MLRLVSRYTGKVFLFVGVILFLFGFFVIDLTSNIDDFKEDFDVVIENAVKDYGIEQCKTNPDMEGCELLLNVEPEDFKLEQGSFEGVTYDQYVEGVFGFYVLSKWIRIISIIMILAGIGLIFLGTLSLFGAISSSGFIIGVSGLLSYFFYKKLFINILNNAMQKIIEGTEGISRIIAENLHEYFIGFVNLSLDKTANFSLIIGIIGLIIGFALYFLKKKGLKK